MIDPATGKPVEDGQQGEVVFTSLTRKAIPIIRFRTGDLTRVLSRGKCDCGRTSLRLDRIAGRLDDMLIVKGVNFFPKQVEQALMEIPGVLSHYQIIIEEVDGVRDVRINVEAEEWRDRVHGGEAPEGKAGLQPAGRCLQTRRPAPPGRQSSPRGLQFWGADAVFACETLDYVLPLILGSTCLFSLAKEAFP